MPVSGNSYADAIKKSYKSKGIQRDESTFPAPEKPKSIAVDTKDVIEIHASEYDESLMEDLPLKPSFSSSLQGASAKP
ncbi:hypothetical protein TNCV_2472431 [Trichonephila clavipes]|nr:hypothetical protein TNCV_2472431 [Trichonephila clavipes]